MSGLRNALKNKKALTPRLGKKTVAIAKWPSHSHIE
jgi:hypothetical protein